MDEKIGMASSVKPKDPSLPTIVTNLRESQNKSLARILEDLYEHRDSLMQISRSLGVDEDKKEPANLTPRMTTEEPVNLKSLIMITVDDAFNGHRNIDHVVLQIRELTARIAQFLS